MNMDFTFEESPWELFSRRVQKGERVSALRLLTVLEGEDDTLVEEAFDALSEKQVVLDLADLPRREAVGELGSRLAWEEKLTRQNTAAPVAPVTPAVNELEAYRRAERTERQARERAELIQRQANAILSDVTFRVNDMAAQVVPVADDLLAQLKQIQDTVTASRQSFQDAVVTLNCLRSDI